MLHVRLPAWARADGPAALALGLGGLGIVAGWRGVDYPAQLFRATLTAESGPGVWNFRWYGGHPTPGYGVLAPALGALVGPVVLLLGSGVAAAACYRRLVEREFGTRGRAGAWWFAAATAVDLAIGRAPFALGLAIGLGALLARQRGRRVAALALAFACPLASPVAAVFLALGFGALAWAGAARRIRRLDATTAVIALVPIAVVAVVYPEGGTFTFTVGDVAFTIAVCVALLWAVPTDARAMRIATAGYLAATIAVFAIPNPLGGNIMRLAMFFGGPVLLCFWRPRRSLALVAVVVALVGWQVRPALGAIVGPDDPSQYASYHQPLVEFLESRAGPSPRVEIPFTKHHWETFHVARHVPIARGWERQLDRALNPLFYEGTLTARRYHQWLVDHAVAFVALPDVDLDYSATAEARLLRAGVPGLRPVWQNAHWRVWRVTDSRPIVGGPGHLVATGFATMQLRADAPGTLTVRVRYTPHYSLTGAGCVERAPGGWTRIRVHRAGPLVLGTRVLGGQGHCN